ncbi:MAG: hypothetical protein AB7P40_31960 [Chloroflexota bacterium]
MSGPFIEVTESDTSRLLLLNAERVVCVAPHGRGGAYVYVMGHPDQLEIEETPERVSELLRGAGVACGPAERSE